MTHDRTTHRQPESNQGEAEDGEDERFARGPSGGIGGAAVVGGTGAGLLLIAAVGVRVLLAPSPQPPFVTLASYAVAAVVAAGGMLITARIVQPRVVPARRAPDRAAPASRLPGPGRGNTPAPAEPVRFQVETRTGRRVIPAADVVWFEAAGNYVRLHLAAGSYVYRVPLNQLEQDLQGLPFLRVHRSAIVNLDGIQRVEPLRAGDAELTLANGARVRLSRRYARAFHDRTGRSY